MAKLSSAEVKRRVAKEVNHIPPSPGPQGVLRAMYWVHRVHCLELGEAEEGADRTILMGCIEAIRGCYRDFEPVYDRKFFG